MEALVKGGQRPKPQSSGGKILYRAVVTEVFSNPKALIPTQINYFKQTPAKQVANLRDFDKMPRNSIAAILIDENGGQVDNTPKIFYPFFSPHFSLPVKPGEQVIVIFSGVNASGKGFWVTRVSTDMDVDDVNYTHGDRVAPETPGGGLIDIAAEVPAGPPSFPNGGGQASNFRLPGLLAYEDIMLKSYAMRLGASLDSAWIPEVGMSAYIGAAEFKGEAVPRYTKKCQDLVLQGSNNNVISLCEDWTVNTNPATKAAQSLLPGRGTIDIVAGVGKGVAGMIKHATTVPIANTRLYQEVDKTLPVQNPLEGDPSGDDASRVYVTMSGICDTAMAVGQAAAGFIASDGAGLVPAPYAVMKSTHVRLISTATGTIRLICGDTPATLSGLELSATGASLVCPLGVHVGLPVGEAVGMPMVYGTPLASALTALATALTTVAGSLTSAGGVMAAPVTGAVAAAPMIGTAGSTLSAAATALSTAAGLILAPTTTCL